MTITQSAVVLTCHGHSPLGQWFAPTSLVWSTTVWSGPVSGGGSWPQGNSTATKDATVRSHPGAFQSGERLLATYLLDLFTFWYLKMQIYKCISGVSYLYLRRYTVARQTPAYIRGRRNICGFPRSRHRNVDTVHSGRDILGNLLPLRKTIGTKQINTHL